MLLRCTLALTWASAWAAELNFKTDVVDCKLGVDDASPDILSSTCALTAPGFNSGDVAGLIAELAALKERVATLEGIHTPPPPSPPPPVGSTEAYPAPSCLNVETAGVTWVATSSGGAVEVFCDGTGWAMISANRLGGSGAGLAGLSLDNSHAIWSGTYSGPEEFTYDGMTVRAEHVSNAIGSVPFTKMRLPGVDTIEFADATTFAQKKAAQTAPTPAGSYVWAASYSGSVSVRTSCLFCYHGGIGAHAGDTNVIGLAVHAQQTHGHSCEGASSTACPGVSSGATSPPRHCGTPRSDI